MAAVTICSDFGAQKNKVWHCFHCFPIYFPWSDGTFFTSCEEMTRWKRLWCWEGLEAGGEGDDRGWDGWMASPTRWTWVWMNSRSWWWTGRPGVLQFMGSQRVRHDWATELNWLMGSDAMILVFWMLSFKPTFSLSSFTFIKRPFSSSLLSAIRVVSSAYLNLLIFLPAIDSSLCFFQSSVSHDVLYIAKAEASVLWTPHAKSWLIGKDSDAGRDWGQDEKGTTEDEMAGWHHRLYGRESEWTPGVGDGQGGLACCSSWGCKETDTSEQLNWVFVTENWDIKLLQL